MTVAVHSSDQIEGMFGNDPAMAAICAKTEADLTVYQALWDAEDERIGYSAARSEEQIAADREQHRFDVLVAAPATRLADVAGKLDAVLREGENAEGCAEFPWQQLRSVLFDLVQIGLEQQPGLFMPGYDRTLSYPTMAASVDDPTTP